jgi:peptidoglycan/LPS O-acetylase OafA/YrhL
VKGNAPKIHYPLLDAIRFAAAIGVVWIHVADYGAPGWSKELGRFAVPFFAGSAVYLAAGSLQRHPRTSMREYIASRFWRIYVLFLVWSLFYWLIRALSSRFLEHTGFPRISIVEFFWDGVAVQLWFLPVIFLATIAAFAVVKVVRLVPALRWPLVCVLAAMALGVALAPAPGPVRHGGYAVGLGYAILPVCDAALALALAEAGGAHDGKDDHPAMNVPMLAVGIALGLPWLVAVLALEPNGALENMAGFGLLLVSLSWRKRAPVPSLMRLGAAAFGIYLIHPLFVEGMQHVLPRLGFRAHGAALEISIFLASLAASYGAVELLRRHRSTRWLTG